MIYLHSLENWKVTATNDTSLKAFGRAAQAVNAKSVVIATTKSDLYASGEAERRHRRFCDHVQAIKKEIAEDVYTLQSDPKKILRVIEAVFGNKEDVGIEELVEPRVEANQTVTPAVGGEVMEQRVETNQAATEAVGKEALDPVDLNQTTTTLAANGSESR